MLINASDSSIIRDIFFFNNVMCTSHNQYECVIISDLKDQRWVQIHFYLKYKITTLQFVLVFNCWWVYASLNIYYNSKHIISLEALISEVSH